MLTTLRQAMHLIGRTQRGRWAMLVMVALMSSGFEIAGATLVYVLIGLVADPQREIDLPILGDVRSFAGGTQGRSLLLTVISVMAIFFVLRGLVQVGSVYLQQRVAENTGARLSNLLVAGYLTWPYEAHLHRNSAEFVRNGHQAVQQLVNQVFVPMVRVTADIFLTVGLLTLMFAIAPAATGIAIFTVGVSSAMVLLIIQPRLKQLGRTAHAMQRETLQFLQQALHGVRDIKVLGREAFFARRFGRRRLNLARAKYLRATLSALPHTIIEIVIIGFILLFFGVTIAAGESADAVLPVLGLFAYVGFRLQPSLQRIIGGLNDIRYSAVPIEDLYADLKRIGVSPTRHADPVPFTDGLVLEDVAFRYQGAEAPALTGVNLAIRPGEQIGICGPTGGGKTTLVDLITGLLHPTHGRITVDGRDLTEHARAWQRNLGVVPQMVFLLDDSLRRNVALGVPDGEIDDEALSEAIDLAQLSEFVASLPEGIETKVGERGVRISGGQRQRIAIARALYRRPAVLIFDEGTSALDNATEAQLMAAIQRLRGKHTIILVAHRLSTVRNSDRVIFIENGRVDGEGTFEVLQEENPRFRALLVSP